MSKPASTQRWLPQYLILSVVWGASFAFTEADLQLLAKTAVEDAVTLNNPIRPTEQDVLGILRRAL
jgi:hypothetical protein